MSNLTSYAIFLRFGLLCFGGGNALTPLYIDELVKGRGWMSLDEFGNLMAIAQITPGPIGINSATFFGYRSGGVAGALCATLGLLTPSISLMLLVASHIGFIERNRTLRRLMERVAPATTALMFAAAHVFAGMSLWDAGGEARALSFALPLPAGAAAGAPERIVFHPFAFAICAAAAWAVCKGKAKITTVILASAASGALFWGLSA